MDQNSVDFVLIVMAGVLGAVALVLSIIYGYIHCVQSKQRHRIPVEIRINRYQRPQNFVQNNKEMEDTKSKKTRIKTHTFIVISYLSKLKSSVHANQSPSTSTKKY